MADDGTLINGSPISHCNKDCYAKCGHGNPDMGEECDYRNLDINYWECGTDCKWLCK